MPALELQRGLAHGKPVFHDPLDDPVVF